MPTKTTTVAKTRARPSADHVSYQDMIIDAIVTLKERNGSSRVALKKYIKANHKNIVDGKMFDSLFNRALKSGVEKGILAQPKGPSGGTKLAKKEPKTSSVPSTKQADAKVIEKKTVEKKAAPSKKAVSAKKVVSRKVEPSSAKAKPTSKSKVSPKAKKSTKSEDASTSEVPAILSRTKSGRVTKSTPAPRKVIAPKKKSSASAKKISPRKSAS